MPTWRRADTCLRKATPSTERHDYQGKAAKQDRGCPIPSRFRTPDRRDVYLTLPTPPCFPFRKGATPRLEIPSPFPLHWVPRHGAVSGYVGRAHARCLRRTYESPCFCVGYR